MINYRLMYIIIAPWNLKHLDVEQSYQVNVSKPRIIII